MNKKEAIQLLNKEGWTKEDAKRALRYLDFPNNSNIDELTIRRAAAKFAGSELIERQRSQAVQKGLVTKERNKAVKFIAKIENLKQQIKEIETGSINSESNSNVDLEQQLQEVIKQNQELRKANQVLMKDNKDLKNIVDAIKLKFTIETKHLLKLENSEIKKGLVKFLKSTLG